MGKFVLLTQENVDIQKLRYSFLFYATHYFVQIWFLIAEWISTFLSNQR